MSAERDVDANWPVLEGVVLGDGCILKLPVGELLDHVGKDGPLCEILPTGCKTVGYDFVVVLGQKQAFFVNNFLELLGCEWRGDKTATFLGLGQVGY